MEQQSRPLVPVQQLQSSWRLLASAFVAFWFTLILRMILGDTDSTPDVPGILHFMPFLAVLSLPFMLPAFVGWVGWQTSKNAWNLLRLLPLAAFILLLVTPPLLPAWQYTVLLVVTLALVAESGGAALAAGRRWDERHSLRRARIVQLLALFAMVGMVSLCIAYVVWTVAPWVQFPQTIHAHSQVPTDLLLNLIMMVIAILIALVAFVRYSFALRAAVAAKTQQGQSSQRVIKNATDTVSPARRDRTDPRVWIIVLPVLVFVFLALFPLVVFQDSPSLGSVLTYLVIDGLASILIAFAVKICRREIAEHPQSSILANIAVLKKRVFFGPHSDESEDDDLKLEITDLPASGEQQGTTRRKFLTRKLVGGAALLIGGAALGPALISLFNDWSAGQGSSAGSPGILPRGQQTILDITWSPDGKQAAFVTRTTSILSGQQGESVLTTNSILLYQVEQGVGSRFEPIPAAFQASNSIALAWAPDNVLLALGFSDGSISLWDTRSPSSVLTYEGSSGQVENIGWSPDGKLIASGGLQEVVRICKASNGTIVSKYAGNTPSETRLLSWSADSTRVVIESESSQPNLQVWEVRAGKTLFAFAEVHMLKVAWSPDGKVIASAGNDGKVYLWNASDGTLIKFYPTQSNFNVDPFWPVELLWSPESKYLALDSRGVTLQVWNVQNNASKLIPIDLGTARASTWLADGRLAIIDATQNTQFIDVKGL